MTNKSHRKIHTEYAMSVRHTFIQNLKYYRKKAGLTQERLAEAIGMSTSYIGDMEARERFPSAETIDKLAGALNIRPSVLFDEFGSPENVQSTFELIYGKTLREELGKRVLAAIDEVCAQI